MRRFACAILVAVVLGALVAPASGRTLKVRSDPNDTFQPPDIRKVWTAQNRRGVYVRVGAWDRLRQRHGFIVVLDTRGDGVEDRILELATLGRQCLVWEADRDGTFGDFIGERNATRPNGRAIACLVPNGWFDITKTVRFYVKSGLGGDRHRDRAPNTRRYVGL